MSESVVISIRIHPEDLADIDSNARCAGMTRNEFLIMSGCEEGAGERQLLKKTMRKIRKALDELSTAASVAILHDTENDEPRKPRKRVN